MLFATLVIQSFFHLLQLHLLFLHFSSVQLHSLSGNLQEQYEHLQLFASFGIGASALLSTLTLTGAEPHPVNNITPNKHNARIENSF